MLAVPLFMKHFFLLIAVLFSSISVAQIDDGNSGFSIPPINFPPPVNVPAPISPSSTSPFPPSFNDPMPGRTTRSIPESSNFKFNQSNDFISRGDEYLQKLNTNKGGDGGDYKAFRKNQYLGDFKTNAKKVTVSYRDHQAEDGDEVRVWVNDRVLKSRIYLSNRQQGFELELKPGFNKIDFEALNQGSSGPNTAEFTVVDDNGVVISSNRWDLATGFKATIILVKE